MHPPTSASTPRRFDRAVESPSEGLLTDTGPRIPLADLEPALAASTLTEGGRALARGLLRTARPALFPGGGLGLDYAALLKTAARPDVVGPHVQEAAQHLTDRRVDLLFVPGMSGYPIGAMYSLASDIPAVLLKKQRHTLEPEPADTPRPAAAESPGRGSTDRAPSSPFPAGAFVIPSYTGDGDTVISADLAAVRDILAGLVAAQLALQAGNPRPKITLRLAGADEIIDKATMAQAITETAPEVCHAVILDLLQTLPETADRQVASLDPAGACPERSERVDIDIRVVAWVTPLLKGYNQSAERLAAATGILPLAGLTLTTLTLDPPAIGIAGLGLVELSER